MRLKVIDISHDTGLCYPRCMQNKSYLIASGVKQCPPPGDDQALCALALSTNIGVVDSNWICDDEGFFVGNKCTLEGIICEESNYVTALSLYSNSITGV